MIDIHAKESNGPSIAHLRAALAESMEDELLADAPAAALLPDVEPRPEAPAFVEVEGPTQFSQSRLWEWQRSFFHDMGADAWSEGIVPHYITSSSYICKCYASVVFGHLRDLHRKGVEGPVYLVELGAGSGQFAFHFLRHLSALMQGSVMQGALNWVYVMTDFTQSNLDFWQQHASLQPYVQDGVLDWALFDCTASTSIELQVSGHSLQANTEGPNMVAIANYLFDTIPQDLFWMDQGQLYECRVALRLPEDSNENDADAIANVQLRYEKSAVRADYYQHSSLDAILAEYASTLNQSAVLFPHQGLQCIERLQALSGGKLMLLTGDKGYVLEEELQHRPLPGITRHGSFSMTVNYHAMKRFAELDGGAMLHTLDPHNSINVCCMLPDDAASWPETRQAFANSIEAFGPDQQFVLKKAIERNYAGLSPGEVLSYIQLSGYDPKAFRRGIASMRSQLPEFTEQLKQQLEVTVLRMWDNYYPLGEEVDLAFLTGVLLYELDLCDRAIDLFEHSLRLYGQNAGTHCNLAMCWFQLGHYDRATEHISTTLQLEPGHRAALELKSRIPAGPVMAEKSLA